MVLAMFFSHRFLAAPPRDNTGEVIAVVQPGQRARLAIEGRGNVPLQVAIVYCRARLGSVETGLRYHLGNDRARPSQVSSATWQSVATRVTIACFTTNRVRLEITGFSWNRFRESPLSSHLFA
jgi:hypothetical protein